jgi:hypothetical protein
MTDKTQVEHNESFCVPQFDFGKTRDQSGYDDEREGRSNQVFGAL